MAVAGGLADILKSGSIGWYAPVGESLPDETTVAYGASWGGNWVELPRLADPLAMEYTEVSVEADEQDALAPVEDYVTEERFRLRSSFNRTTGDLLALLTGATNTDTAAGASQKAYSRILGGGNPFRTKYVVGFEGYRPDTAGTLQPVRFFFYKARFKLEIGLTQSKRDVSKNFFSIMTFADTSKAVGQQHFEWHIVTGPTT